MKDINKIYKEYQALRKEKALNEKKANLSEAISVYINTQRKTLAKANKTLKRGNVEGAYLILTGKNLKEKISEEQPIQVVEATKSEVAVRISAKILYGADRKSGKILWEYGAPNFFPIFTQDENSVFVADHETLVVLDKRSGKEISKRKMMGCLEGLLQEKSILFAASNDTISAYRTKDFQELWKEKIYDAIQLAKSGENLFISTQEKLLALDPATGELKWENPYKGNTGRLITGGANNDGNVYTYLTNHLHKKIEKLSKSGRIVWTHCLSSSSVTTMKAHDIALYVGLGGDIRAFNANTGEIMWKNEIGDKYTYLWQIEIDKEKNVLEIVAGDPYYTRKNEVVYLNPKTGKRVQK